MCLFGCFWSKFIKAFMVPTFFSKTMINAVLCDSGRTQKQLLECMGSGEKKHSHFDRSDWLDVPVVAEERCLAGVFSRFEYLSITDIGGKDLQMFIQRKHHVFAFVLLLLIQDLLSLRLRRETVSLISWPADRCFQTSRKCFHFHLRCRVFWSWIMLKCWNVSCPLLADRSDGRVMGEIIFSKFDFWGQHCENHRKHVVIKIFILEKWHKI